MMAHSAATLLLSLLSLLLLLHLLPAAVGMCLLPAAGHCMLLEVLDSQFRPSKFPRTFMFALIYVTSTLTVPNAAFTFLAFPEQATKFGAWLHYS
jgi:hypothetical protein